jgi:hypothetical protein
MGRDEERGVSLDREVTHKEALPSSASQVRDMNLYEGTSLEALPLDIRMRFRFKMLTLVWLNNGIIISCAALFAFIQPIDEWMGDAGSKRRSGFGWLSIFMSIGSSLLLVKAHETELFPYNFGFLLFFDISIGFCKGYVHHFSASMFYASTLIFLSCASLIPSLPSFWYNRPAMGFVFQLASTGLHYEYCVPFLNLVHTPRSILFGARMRHERKEWRLSDVIRCRSLGYLGIPNRPWSVNFSPGIDAVLGPCELHFSPNLCRISLVSFASYSCVCMWFLCSKSLKPVRLSHRAFR